MVQCGSHWQASKGGFGGSHWGWPVSSMPWLQPGSPCRDLPLTPSLPYFSKFHVPPCSQTPPLYLVPQLSLAFQMRQLVSSAGMETAVLSLLQGGGRAEGRLATLSLIKYAWWYMEWTVKSTRNFKTKLKIAKKVSALSWLGSGWGSRFSFLPISCILMTTFEIPGVGDLKSRHILAFHTADGELRLFRSLHTICNVLPSFWVCKRFLRSLN